MSPSPNIADRLHAIVMVFLDSPSLQSLDTKQGTKITSELLVAEVSLTHDQRMVPVLAEPLQPSWANHLPKETKLVFGLRVIALES